MCAFLLPLCRERASSSVSCLWGRWTVFVTDAFSESGVVTENQSPSWAESSARLLTSVYVVLGQHDTVGSPLATHRKGSPGSVRISSPLASWFHYMFM